MKRKTLTLLLVSLLVSWSTFAQQSNNFMSKQIQRAHDNGVQFESVELFSKAPAYSAQTQLNSFVKQASILKIDAELLSASRTNKNEAISMPITLPDGKQYELELVKVDVLTDDFILTASASGNTPLTHTPPVCYRGIIKGKENSMAALSLDNGEVFGIFNTQEDGNIILGKIEKDAENKHILYYEKDMLVTNNSTCDAPPMQLTPQQIEEFRHSLEHQSSRRASKCVRVYFECEYDMFQEKGTVAATSSYITNVFNVVALLYSKENITTKISQIKVWNTADSYPTSSTSAALNAFRTNGGSFNADLGHLVSRGAPTGGGVAWLNVLCNSSYNRAYSYIHSSFNNFPTYSWTVMVVTHEMGHNLGSPHTQSCSWPGGAIDNCYTPEGSCSPGPAPTNGGTIMSYCHLTSHGINLQNGFGTLPGNLIRSRVNGASCLQACGGGGGGCTKNKYTLTLVTDNYGSETSWTVKNSSGATVQSGSGYSSNKTYNIELCLDNGCYKLEIKDSYGDGMCCGYGNGSYTLKKGSTTVASGGNFTSSVTHNFCTSANTPGTGAAITSTNDISPVGQENLELYPSPARDVVNVAFNAKGENTSLIIMDAVGRIVWEKQYNTTEGFNKMSVDIQSFEVGSYIFVLKSDFYVQQRSFVISK